MPALASFLHVTLASLVSDVFSKEFKDLPATRWSLNYRHVPRGDLLAEPPQNANDCSNLGGSKNDIKGANDGKRHQ